MRFAMPVTVYEEEECVRNHPEVFAAAGKKALLVTGRHSADRNGAAADVLSVLEDCGIASARFREVEENPCVETVMRARKLGLSEGADFVVGIGGGSAMDAAKAIALMMRHPEEGADYLYGSRDASRVSLILVPTTCGTGSEVTPVSVLTLPERRTKASTPHPLFADAALIDGRYLAFAPEKVIRNTAIDALGHLFESYLNADATDYSRMCVDAGLKIWSRSRDVLLRSAAISEDVTVLPAYGTESDSQHMESPGCGDAGQDTGAVGADEAGSTPDPDASRIYTAEDYANLMRASALAGMAIAQTGTALPHGLSYPITFDLHMAHGRAVGYFEAGYLAAAPEEESLYLLHTAGFENLAALQDFYEAMCGSARIPAAELEHAVDMLCENPAKLAKAPFRCDREVLRRIAFWPGED